MPKNEDRVLASDIEIADDGSDTQMVFEISWPASFGPTWMNIDNLKLLLFSKEPISMSKNRIGVRVLDNHEMINVNDKLNNLSRYQMDTEGLMQGLGQTLEDMDNWLVDHYQSDGVSPDLVREYNRRLKERFGTCSWCGGHVFSRAPDALGNNPVLIVDHQVHCPFRE